MDDVHVENCPLCNRLADYENGDGHKRQRFYCEYCKNFIIASIAKRKVPSEINLPEKFSKLSASLNEDKLLHIFYEKDKFKFCIENKGFWQKLA
ncbi:MAG: hypothetical protein H7Z70_03435 [Bacteroidia bacterium]|nr:hypothetical protein [Methylotenera sp.]